MTATKRLSQVATGETLDKLAADVLMPIPDMGLARLLANIFNVLGLGFIILGAVALYFGLQPAAAPQPASNTTNLLQEMGQLFGGSSRAALVLASIIGIVGGASYMLVGATVNMIADIRIEAAHNRRLLAAVLESNLRPHSPNQKMLPPQPIIITAQPSPPSVEAAEPAHVEPDSTPGMTPQTAVTDSALDPRPS
jgi:hypothetical protein